MTRELILALALAAPLLYGVARLSVRVDHIAREARRR